MGKHTHGCVKTKQYFMRPQRSRIKGQGTIILQASGGSIWRDIYKKALKGALRLPGGLRPSKNWKCGDVEMRRTGDVEDWKCKKLECEELETWRCGKGKKKRTSTVISAENIRLEGSERTNVHANVNNIVQSTLSRDKPSTSFKELKCTMPIMAYHVV